jgi:hypothetical protein
LCEIIVSVNHKLSVLISSYIFTGRGVFSHRYRLQGSFDFLKLIVVNYWNFTEK